MNLTPEELTEIEKFGELFLEPSEIAIIIGKDEQDFTDEIKDKDTAAYKAYWKGFLKSKALVRDSIVKSAQRDSSPAQTLLNQTIIKLERKLKLNE